MSTEPRAQRRHRRQPAGRDLAEVHGGGHRGRRHRLVRPSRPSSPGSVLHEELEPTTTTGADLVHQLHDARAPRRPPCRTPPRPRRPSSTTSTTGSTTTTTDRAGLRAPLRDAGRRPSGCHPPAAPPGGCAAWRSVEELVRVARAAREAPVLDGVEHLHLLLLVPRLGGEVDAVQGDDVDAVVPAAVAVPERHATIMPCRAPSPAGPTALAEVGRSRAPPSVRCAHRRQPPGRWTDQEECDAHEAHRARHPGSQGPSTAATRS